MGRNVKIICPERLPKVDSDGSCVIFGMRRRKKVEGLVLDLTRVADGVPFVLEEYIVTAPEPFVSGICEACGSSTIGALRVHEGAKKCGICRAVADGRISAELCEMLRAEYAKPCGFCGDSSAKKHFDHVNMFSKLDCVGFMVEKGCNEESIVTELEKCQILCVPCHRKVTMYERRKGFFSKKRAFNKLLRAGEDVEDLRIALYEEYSVALEPYYERLRGGPHGK